MVDTIAEGAIAEEAVIIEAPIVETEDRMKAVGAVVAVAAILPIQMKTVTIAVVGIDMHQTEIELKTLIRNLTDL